MGEPSIKTPQKKPKNRELTASQKQQNKEFSSERIVVEHVIRLMKIFRVASELDFIHLPKLRSHDWGCGDAAPP